jgi:chromosome segregation protein
MPPYVKRLVMKGFKSFAKQTEIPFSNEINVVLGPNGSGKSNVSDALCFVLGRLSIKSLRAAKASNLIFMGTKAVGPAKEASVEIVFNNSDKIFAIDSDELSIKRIVRTNGQGVYKINNETKTRQEVLEVLAHAGIDPHGFNIVLQGEIQNLVRMNGEDRRKIIEEVSGISVYELRKQKTLKELEKTEEKLKEISAVLRERTSYLNNLEKERQQALRFKELQKIVRSCKRSIFDHDLKNKEKEVQNVESAIQERLKELEKIRDKAKGIQTHIQDFETQISKINSLIQQATGFEQEKLNREIADSRANMAGLKVRKENFERKLKEIAQKSEELVKSIKESESTLSELAKKSPGMKKTSDELKIKKEQLDDLEKQRKKFYMLRSEIKSIRERIGDKKSLLNNYSAESQMQVKQIEMLHSELFDKSMKNSSEILNEKKAKLKDKRERLSNLAEHERQSEKVIDQSEYEIHRLKKVKDDIEKLDICPLCKSQVTEDHINKIEGEMQPQIKELKDTLDANSKQLDEIRKQKSEISNSIDALSEEIRKRESDMIKIFSINEKKDRIKVLQERIDSMKKEISELEKKEISADDQITSLSSIDEKYEKARLDIQDLSLRSEENLDAELTFKKREIERNKALLKQLSNDDEDTKDSLASLEDNIQKEEDWLDKKVEQEEELSHRFKKLFSDRDELQDKIHSKESERMRFQQEVHNKESEINDLKINKAKVSAELENISIDAKDFSDAEPIKGSREHLIQRMESAENTLQNLGSVNLRSLEVYDNVKKEYDIVQSKVETVQTEKDKIIKVIHEIDIKKRKTFNNTLDAINQLFSNNFAQLSTKGEVNLDLENKKEPFEGGLNISVKVGKGKYFDVTSLSGGEQTLVALSLIFAIQEYRPYCFYILDEIDAALDKRNSERLGNLLKKYMSAGQYIIITHNDEIISQASTMYGISMHDGISKVMSMKLTE